MADDRRTPRLAAAYCAAADEWYHIAGRDTGATTTAEHIVIRMSEAVLAADPLRALLADEDRAVEVIRDAIAKSDAGTLSSRYLKETSVAVLAALREVAGNPERTGRRTTREEVANGG